MSNKMERLTLWWAQCFAPLAKGLASDESNASEATARFSASLELLGEAQDLAIRAMQRFKDLAPQMKETQEMIARLQGQTARGALKPPGKPGEGAGVVLVDGEAGPCLECSGEVGMGPVGWRQGAEPGPLCNLCLARESPDLGALMGVVNQVRRIVRQGAEEHDDPDAAGSALLDLARRYARANASGWPVRPTELLSKASDLHLRMVERHGPHYLDEVKRQGGGQEPN